MNSFEKTIRVSRNGLPLPEKTRVYDGKSVFGYLDHELREALGISPISQQNDIHSIVSMFSKFFKKEEGLLTRYLRSLLSVLKYIDESPLIEQHEKENYVRIVSHHLTLYEGRVLYYCVYLGRSVGAFSILNLKYIYEKYKLFTVSDSSLYSDTHKTLISKPSSGD